MIHFCLLAYSPSCTQRPRVGDANIFHLIFGSAFSICITTSTDTEMSDQEVIYSTPAFLQNPSELQNTLRPGGTQRPGKIDGKEFSGPSRLIAVALGILCLLLIMTIIVLGTMLFQCNQQKHQQDKILQNHIMQNNNCLTKQHLANTTPPASDILENKTVQWEKKPVSPLIEKKTCHRKKKISSKSLQHTGKLNEELWSCCGVNCYLFTTENKNWKECKQTCQNKGLSLVKIDDEDEWAFLQSQTYKNSYWIGLSFNEKERKWEWIDKGTPGIYVSIMNRTFGRGECAFLTSTRIANIDCSKTYYCICVKNNVVNDIH